MSLCLQYKIEANHNKDYSVVKTFKAEGKPFVFFFLLASIGFIDHKFKQNECQFMSPDDLFLSLIIFWVKDNMYFCRSLLSRMVMCWNNPMINRPTPSSL